MHTLLQYVESHHSSAEDFFESIERYVDASHTDLVQSAFRRKDSEISEERISRAEVCGFEIQHRPVVGCS